MKIIKVYKDSCAPCKVLSERLESAGIEHDSMEADPVVIDRFGIRSVPTLLFIDDEGQVVDRLLGLVSIDQIKRRLDVD